MATDKQQQQQLSIELSEETAEGIYSNLAVISHSNTEFIIDFLKMMPGMQKAKVKSRIVLTPQHAKRLMRALEENLQKFEQAHGRVADAAGNQIQMPFGNPTGQA